MTPLDRQQWLGYRWQRHGFGAEVGTADDLLLLGFQDSRGGGAAQSIAARTGISVDDPMVTLWSVRGAPHTHRLADLDPVRDALAPVATDEGGPAYVAHVGQVAAALTAVVTGPTPKGTASHEMRTHAPSLVRPCATCRTEHVPDGLFRAGGRQAQLVLGPEENRSTILLPTPRHRAKQVEEPRLELLRAYLRVNGPTTRTTFRDWAGMDTGTVAGLWQGLELVKVTVDGRRLEAPEAVLDAVLAAEGVVLVPPHDPYLRQVDRTLLVPDSARRREVWRALSPPGALLVDGEVAGTWRYKRSAGELTVTPFEKLSREAVEKSAHRVAGDPVTLVWA